MTSNSCCLCLLCSSFFDCFDSSTHYLRLNAIRSLLSRPLFKSTREAAFHCCKESLVSKDSLYGKYMSDPFKYFEFWSKTIEYRSLYYSQIWEIDHTHSPRLELLFSSCRFQNETQRPEFHQKGLLLNSKGSKSCSSSFCNKIEFSQETFDFECLDRFPVLCQLQVLWLIHSPSH